MKPRTLLRGEGAVVFALAVAGYFTLDGPLWLFAVLALAPDISMLGYLAGPRIGSRSYNLVHTYTLPLALGAFGFWGNSQLALLIALVWSGHIGADRLAGYGLKFDSGFTETHLSAQPAPLSALMQSDE